MYSNCNRDGFICDFQFKVPVISLNSGNDNRDSNMLNYLKAFSYPEIILDVQNFEIKEYNSKFTSECKTWIVVIKFPDMETHTETHTAYLGRTVICLLTE